jgi:small GTP-binding protein
MNRIKLIFVGEGKVGETSLISQYTEKKFDEEYTMTVGNDKVYKELEINNKKISLEIWDTPGQKDYNAVTKIFMKNAKIAIIVYSIIDKKSFENLKNWIDMVNKSNKNQEVVIGIVANKSDLFENQIVSKEEGEKFAKDNNALFFETSAKDYNSIDKVFVELCKCYFQNYEKNKQNNNSITSQQIDNKTNNELANIDNINNKDLNSKEQILKHDEIDFTDIPKKDDDCSSKCYII